MNRQQRRAAMRAQQKKGTKKEASLNYEQSIALANQAYQKGKEKSTEDYPKVFMYTFSLILKTLREQWGWGHVRLARLTEQVLAEFNENDMNMQEMQDWMWEYIGIKLQLDDEE